MVETSATAKNGFDKKYRLVCLRNTKYFLSYLN